MKTKTLLISLIVLFSLPSCNNYQECIEEVSPQKLEKILQNRKENCFVFFFDKTYDEFNEINKQANIYYKKNNYLSFYKVNVESIENEEYYISLIKQVYNGITTLSNATAFFNNGLIYKAYDKNLFTNNELNPTDHFFNYISGFGNFANKIDNSQPSNSLIVINQNEFNEKINNKDNFLVMVGQEKCFNCQECENDLYNYFKNNKYEIYYIEYVDNFEYKIDYTPTFLTFNDGKLVNYYLGCYSQNQLKELFS